MISKKQIVCLHNSVDDRSVSENWGVLWRKEARIKTITADHVKLFFVFIFLSFCKVESATSPYRTLAYFLYLAEGVE